MNYKKSYQIYRIGLFAVIALIAASLLLQIDWLGIVGVVLFVFDLLQTGIFYRCPNCGKALNFRRCLKTRNTAPNAGKSSISDTNGAGAPNARRKGGAAYAGRHSHHRQADGLDEHGRASSRTRSMTARGPL